jgi:hypothetical protein
MTFAEKKIARQPFDSSFFSLLFFPQISFPHGPGGTDSWKKPEVEDLVSVSL